MKELETKIENKKESAESDMKQNSNSGFIKGLIYGIALTALFFILSNRYIIFSPLKNGKDIYNKLCEINYYIDKHNIHEKDEEYIGDMICLGMIAGLKDEYAYYYSQEEVKKLTEKISGEYVGIGVLVIESKNSPYLRVTNVFENSPAKIAGIEVNDEIVEIDGENLEGYSSDEIVAMVRGERGTQVKIKVKRNDDYIDLVATREPVDTPIVYENYDEETNILYLNLTSFEGKGYEQILKARAKYDNAENKVKGVVVDLRNCPGGNLKELILISDIFLDKRLITFFEDKSGKKKEYYSNSGNWNIPMVILVNEYSASAAEAFTGAMQDNKRAYVIGTNTYGKGVVQEIYKLHDNSAIKITMAKYFTPNGNEVNKKGITPDEIIELDPNTKEDNQLERAYEYLKNMNNE